MSKIDAGRRAFLRGALLTRAGRRTEVQRQQPLGPPPPWHRGQALLDACQGCAQPCVGACGPGIIRLHPANHTLAGTPYLDFAAGGCTFCRACLEACPLDLGDPGTALPDIGKARLDRGVCIAWNDVICTACQQRCDYQAIRTVHQRRTEVSAERCNGCGMCVSVCPVGALGIA